MRIEGDPMRYGIIVGFIVALAVVTQVNADCVKNEYGKHACGKGQCQLSQYGKAYCAQEGGGAINGLYDNVLCGIGYCIKDDLNQVWCSMVQGGEAYIDTNGKVVCTGGCEAGSSSRCVEARFTED
jgi:hypothetical protein